MVFTNYTFYFFEDQPYKIILVEEDPDNKCPLCHEPTKDGTIVVRTGICPHLYCPECYADTRLTTCAGCTQNLVGPCVVGEPVCVRIVINVDN